MVAIPFTYYRRNACPDSVKDIRPNHGNEAAVYIRFILDNYDHHLPQWTVFLHGHLHAWHQEGIVRILRGLLWGKQPFMNLSFRNLTASRRAKINGNHLWQRIYVPKMIPSWWNHLFGSVLKKEVVSSYCCAQFVVSRERILAIPKDRWQLWYDWLISEEVPSSLSGRIFEYYWSVIFGEPYDSPVYPEGMCYVTKCSQGERDSEKENTNCSIPREMDPFAHFTC